MFTLMQPFFSHQHFTNMSWKRYIYNSVTMRIDESNLLDEDNFLPGIMSGTPLTLPSNDVNYFSIYHERRRERNLTVHREGFLLVGVTANQDSHFEVTRPLRGARMDKLQVF